ncbi:MAG: YkgJ family cysteine cluster protein [Desulfobacteraceae bacterium]
MTDPEDGESGDCLGEISLKADFQEFEKKQTLEIMRNGQPRTMVLELAPQAHRLAGQIISRVEKELGGVLPPVACKAGCSYCCYHQIFISPPEAFLIGDYLRRKFTDQDRRMLAVKVKKNMQLLEGKDLEAIVRSRPQLECIFLQNNRCSLYEVRPMGCRAWSSRRAEQCKIGLETGDPLAGIGSYIHRQKLSVAIHTGLLQGTQEMGLESGYMGLAHAVNILLHEDLDNLTARWLNGEEVFSSILNFRV